MIGLLSIGLCATIFYVYIATHLLWVSVTKLSSGHVLHRLIHFVIILCLVINRTALVHCSVLVLNNAVFLCRMLIHRPILIKAKLRAQLWILSDMTTLGNAGTELRSGRCWFVFLGCMARTAGHPLSSGWASAIYRTTLCVVDTSIASWWLGSWTGNSLGHFCGYCL